jgi:hypothetical protein
MPRSRSSGGVNFGRRVKEFDQLWTVDEVLVDADRRTGVDAI